MTRAFVCRLQLVPFFELFRRGGLELLLSGIARGIYPCWREVMDGNVVQQHLVAQRVGQTYGQ
jgi:hypothetical protein